MLYVVNQHIAQFWQPFAPFCGVVFLTFFQSFGNLPERPLLVDLTVEEGQRLKVVYGSNRGFHGIDLDTSAVFDVYIPTHVSKWQMTINIYYASMVPK
jgi:hypothetical protein